MAFFVEEIEHVELARGNTKSVSKDLSALRELWNLWIHGKRLSK